MTWWMWLLALSGAIVVIGGAAIAFGFYKLLQM